LNFALRLTLWALSFAPGGRAGAPEPDTHGPIFLGALVSANETHVILVDPANGHSSGWIRAGARFGDYQVGRYDAATENLTLTKGSVELTIHLAKESKVVALGTPVQIGNMPFRIFADSSETVDGVTIFRGSVSAVSDAHQVSSGEVRFDAVHGTIEFTGGVRFEGNGILLTAERLRLVPNRETGQIDFELSTPEKKPAPTNRGG
jgi:hypothetical protein